MFDFKKKDERVSSLENRATTLEHDFQVKLGQLHRLISDMSDMRDHVVMLEKELTVTKNLLIIRNHAEIKRQEDLVENATTASEEVIAVKRRRKARRYNSSDAPDVALRKSLDRETYWRTKAKELEEKLATNPLPPSPQLEVLQ
jgi:hypothetical protein